MPLTRSAAMAKHLIKERDLMRKAKAKGVWIMARAKVTSRIAKANAKLQMSKALVARAKARVKATRAVTQATAQRALCRANIPKLIAKAQKAAAAEICNAMRKREAARAALRMKWPTGDD